MNLEEYKAFLRTVDWSYYYSDNYTVYAKGVRATTLAKQLANTDEQFMQAYEEAKK